MSLLSFLQEKLSRNKQFDKPEGSLYDFSFKLLDGKEFNMKDVKDKNILIVNTASKCGFTYQYEELQKLYEQNSDKLIIIGFPANNFLWQEPGSNSDIENFCQVNYGVTFPMAEKTSVIGKDKHPLYKWLAAYTGQVPGWNFCKYLINPNAERISFYSSKVSPLANEIVSEIEKAK
ncbi:MAG: glutathione peroxidase [Cyclobacteriaceae bacterium]|jgi:glutathione peroxidase|nr:glutathione peroxidase [Cyclobacteriaceae bacterium]